MVRMDSLSSVPPHIQPPMAQVPSAIRELIRLVPAMFMYSSMLILLFSLVGDRHISGWPEIWRSPTKEKRRISMLEYMNIAGTNLISSRIALGTWAMGGWMWGGTDERESIRTIHAAVEQGINLVDTAPVYGFGRSEEIVGEALRQRGRRESIILATKVGLDWTNGKIERNSTRQHILQELEDSLRRLQTDYVDIYQVHWPDPLVPVEDTAATLRELYEQGKIRAIGASNYSPEQMAR